MNLAKIKPKAIAKLKNGETPESIGEELGISAAIVQEWQDDLSPSEITAREVNAIALTKATDILAKRCEIDAAELQSQLLQLALNLVEEARLSLFDIEMAKALNLSADTVAKLQRAFFSESTRIAFFNGNVGGDMSAELRKFKSMLKE